MEGFEMNPILIKINRVDDCGTIKGYATVCCDAITISSIKIIQQNGQNPWIQLPHNHGVDGNWYPVIQYKDQSIMDAIKKVIIDEFNKENNNNEVS